MKTIGICLLIMMIMVQTIEGGCGCESLCRKKGQKYGICGDGHTCICSSKPITDMDNGCGCKASCQKEGHPGGICGDGHTCICSPKADEKSREYTRGQYKLTIINNASSNFNEQTRQRIIDTYFQVYPKIHSRFNKKASKNIQITIDPAYDGVAYAFDGQIVVSATYLKKHPKDIDLVTHELMHVVQLYPSGQPGWLVEGIADYVRWKYGRDNAGGNWHLPKFDRSQQYSSSYGVTARFLAWLERKGHDDIINRLDQALRGNQYENGKLWNKLTGKNVDQLWKDYANNSNL